MRLFTSSRWTRCFKFSRIALILSAMLASSQVFSQAQSEPQQTPQGKEHPVEHPTVYRTTQIDGLSIFYREAGPKDAPTILLSPRSPFILAHVRPSLCAARRSLSPRRPRLPWLRTQRLARPEKICLHLRSHRRGHESFHRSARSHQATRSTCRTTAAPSAFA